MTLIEEHPEHEQALEQLLNSLQHTVDHAVRTVCQEQYEHRPHESIITGRLIQQIEAEVRHAQLELGGLQLEVLARDFPQVAERKVGADLYVSVARLDTDAPKTKGMLVQVKWDHALARSDEWRRLRNQSKRMLRRSEESETWILTPNGVRVVDARKTANEHRPNNLFEEATTPGQIIADGLRCERGDMKIGRDPYEEPSQAIGEVMRRLSVPHSVSFTVR